HAAARAAVRHGMTAAALSQGGSADPRWWRLALGGAVAGYAFFAAFSTAGVALSLGAMFLLVLLRPRVLWQARPWREPAMLLGLALFAWIAVHTLATSGFTAQARGAINRYHELLLAPMLLVLLRDPAQRRRFLRW